MPNFGFDDWIDAQLRKVPVPPELLARLADTTAESQTVVPPPIAADSTCGDPQLDLLLRDVPVPSYLESRLLRIGRQPRPRAVWRRFGLAASVLVAVGLGAAGYLGLQSGVFGPGPERVANQKPRPTATPDVHKLVATKSTRQAKATPLAEQARLAAAANTAAHPQEPAPIPEEWITPANLAERFGQFEGWLADALATRRRSLAAFGAGGHFERLPALDAMEMPVPRGLAPPLVHGYDMLFHLKHGEHPFVSPAAQKELMSTAVPLTFDTTSYDLALRSLAGGAMPPADEIQIEEFLAGQRFAMRAPQPGELILQTATCPSPFGEKGLYMMEVALQIGPARSVAHPPTRLVVAVDTSSAMNAKARWEMVLRSLEKISHQMAPADRVTLVGFAELPQMLAENLKAEQLRALANSGELARPAGSSNLSAAIASVCELIHALPSGEVRRIIFLTAGSRQPLDDAVLATASGSLAELAAIPQVSWQIASVGGPVDPQWSTLAERGRGEIGAAATPAELQRLLVTRLTGHALTVASRAKLKMTFNPRIVTGYRLMGHAATTLTGGSNAPLEIDLDTDQNVANLFEVFIKPDGGDQIAAAEFTWHDPQGGQSRRAVRVVERRQLAASFSKAPGWLQHGIVAAKTAEALRGGFFAPSPHPQTQILAIAGDVDPRVAESPDFQALLALLRQNAEKRH